MSNVSPLIRGTYFDWLLSVLDAELKNTPPGEKLTVVVPSIDRLVRPFHFDRTKESRKYTGKDWDLFDKLLGFYFGDSERKLLPQ